MTRDLTDGVCSALPGAEWADHRDGSHDAWKVGGKMFATIGMMNDGVSVKTPNIETAQFLIELGRAIKAPYFHRSWVRIPWGHVPDDELQDRILTSYRLVRQSLPKRVQAQLPALPD
ncbi:MmcQ/YjbR family DNA-binding protein [Shimia ponticola]|uniref:MmcQ/YjbR family DNA-binding protein n=1 Tax=Shimia ponticola TaxID=2582893 RepID=UPI0011BDB4C1|nr:MmcQ/YjbR family DNA-binding protein [Shimia ponticola]